MDTYLHDASKTEDVRPLPVDGIFHDAHVDGMMNPARKQVNLISIREVSHDEIAMGSRQCR